AICGKGGKIVHAGKQARRPRKRFAVNGSGDVPGPPNLQWRMHCVVYDSITVNLAFRGKTGVKALCYKTRPQDPNRWRQHAVQGLEPALGGEMGGRNVDMRALTES